MSRARIAYRPSAEPQGLLWKLHLVSPPASQLRPVPPFEEETLATWFERGACVGDGFAPGDAKIEVLTPFGWGPEVTRLAGLGGLASPGSAPLVLPMVLEARWRVSSLSAAALRLAMHEMLTGLRLGPRASVSPCATVAQVEAIGGLASEVVQLEPKDLGRSCAGSGRTPPFRVKYEPQAKTKKRGVTIETRTPKDPDVRGELDITLQRWASVLERWLAAASPSAMPRWLDTDESKVGAKGERFVVKLMEWEEPVSFAWPFDAAHPLGLLLDMLTVTHLRGTEILGVSAAI